MRASGYRRILDANPVPVVAVNRSLKVVYANAAFRDLFPKGRSKGQIGEVFPCGETGGDCRKCARRGDCPYRSVFGDSINGKGGQSVPMIIDAPVGGAARGGRFMLKVRPVGGGLWTGTLENAAEYGMAADLAAARDLQRKFLPAGSWVGGKRYCFMNDQVNPVGGDIVKAFDVNGSAFGLIADVSGKGLAAAYLSAFVEGAIDDSEPSPAESIKEISRRFSESSFNETNYITVAAVRIDESAITYSLAGHNAPILLKTDTGVTRISAGSFPVCNWRLDDPRYSPHYFEDTLPYSPGDILVLMTDGVTECENAQGERFGEENVVRILSQSSSCNDFMEKLRDGIADFGGIPSDDLTAIAFSL